MSGGFLDALWIDSGLADDLLRACRRADRVESLHLLARWANDEIVIRPDVPWDWDFEQCLSDDLKTWAYRECLADIEAGRFQHALARLEHYRLPPTGVTANLKTIEASPA